MLTLTVEEFTQQFGGNAHRQGLLAHLNPFLIALRAQFRSFRIVAFGSFITEKQDPTDIDLMVHVVTAPADSGYNKITRLRTLANPALDVFTLKIAMSQTTAPLPSAEEMVEAFNDRESHREKGISCVAGVGLI